MACEHLFDYFDYTEYRFGRPRPGPPPSREGAPEAASARSAVCGMESLAAAPPAVVKPTNDDDQVTYA